MPEKLSIPPQRKPVSEYPTPSPSVVIYTERVNRTDPAYVNNAPVARGTLYSSMVGGSQEVTATYPNLYFLKERRFGQSDQEVLWDWATVPDAEDTYNAEISYVSDSVLHPAYSRVYTLRRDDYDASPTLAEGSTLTGLIGVRIIDGGQGYTYATGTINNTDVDIEFVIQDGEIVSGVVKNEGTGILSTSTIVIAGDGAAAVAVPIVQGTSCYLINQKKQEFPEDHSLRNEFVRVVRVYETLPGVYITTSRVDEDGMPITVIRRHNLQSNIDLILPRETLVANVWTRITSEPVNESYFVGWEVRESRTVGLGNTLTDTKIDEDGIPITMLKSLQATTDIISNEVVGGGFWSKRYGQHVSDLVSWEIQEIRAIPGNPIPSTKFRSDGSTVFVTKTLGESSAIVPGGVIAGGFLVLTRKEEVSDLVAWQVQETSELPGPDVHGQHIDETYGLVVDITKTIVQDNTFITPNPAVDGTYYEYKTKDKWESIQIASKFNLDSLPTDVQWNGGMIYSFPPELVDARIDWATAVCGCSSSFSADLIANMKQYHGPVKTRITEQFYFDIPPDDVTITQFFPESHNFGYAWFSFCGTTDGDCRTKTGAPHFFIPLCLHDDLTLTIGLITFSFAATSPAALPHGSYIMLPPHIERWRFGVFRRVLTEVLVP